MSEANALTRKFECGPRPATPDRIFRVFLTCPCHRRGGAMTASARQRPQAGAAFAKASSRVAILRQRISNFAVANGLSIAPKSKRGRRPQRPGNQSR